MKLSTRAVHGGGKGRDQAGVGRGWHPVSTPIDPSATFYFDRSEDLDGVAGGVEGYMYGRYRNPTGVALEQAVSNLETAPGQSGVGALGFGSGMAALHAAILASGVTPGDAIVCSQEIYGGTIGLLMNVMAPLGIEMRFADLTKPDELDRALGGAGARLVIIETISNPLLRVVDVRQVAEKAHAAGAKLLADATFTSPALMRALDFGADYSVHSATKYLSGHGDVVGGIVAAREAELAGVEPFRKLVGGVLGPFEAWLILRGLKTLPLRMERQCANAARVAEFLRGHAGVERVYYPGFADHPDHDIAARQFGGRFGGLVSFEVSRADKPAMLAFLDRLRLCLPCTSLGDVQTLVMYPLIASHRDLAPKQRQRIGIRDNLLRLSVGIEDADDLIADLDQALKAAATVAG